MNGPLFFLYFFFCGLRGRDRTYYRNRNERRDREGGRAERASRNIVKLVSIQWTCLVAVPRMLYTERREAECISSHVARCISARRHCRHHHHFHRHRNKRLMTPKRHSIRQTFMKS